MKGAGAMSSRNILILALALFAKISVSLQSYLDKYFLVYHAKNTYRDSQES